MKTKCPYCGEPYEIDDEHLEKKLECFNCQNKFEVRLVAAPKLGTMYLDIESTKSPAAPDAEIASMVWWCNGRWHSWVKGVDDPALFSVFWRNAPWIVTFDRKPLYEPLLCSQLGLEPHPNHLDLREKARKRGMPGGLKALGEVFGFPRAVGLENRNEETAAKLWERYCSAGDAKALENLRYCCAWNVVLTYHLHCFFSEKEPLAMHTSIPYTLDAHFVDSVVSQNAPPPVIRPPAAKAPAAQKSAAPSETVTLRRKNVEPAAVNAPAKKKIIIRKPPPEKQGASRSNHTEPELVDG